MADKFAFCKVTWLPEYRGERHTSTRYRNIKNADDDDDGEGAEAYLFLPHRGHCYGYVHLGRTDPDDDDTIRCIDLRQLGGTSSAELVRGVHIVWIAARLDGSGICVVGDYRDANVYRSGQASIGQRNWGWNISARKSDVRMIPEAGRVRLARVPLRQGNLWYAKGSGDAAVRKAALNQLARLAVSLA